MNSSLQMTMPQRHSCGTVLEEKEVPVDPRVLNRAYCPASYCSNCEIYKFNKIESPNPQVVGDYICKLQRETNKKLYGSPFSFKFSESQNKKS